MSRFIETIRATNGRLGDLRFHQQRVDETLEAFHGSRSIALAKVLQEHTITEAPISKIRLCYSLNGVESIESTPYTIRSVQSLSLADIGTHRYDFKFEDRAWLQAMVAAADSDDIILCEGPLIKDASYANIAFFDGQQWFTPRHPLLQGTKRRAMVQEGLLIEKEIRREDILQYRSVKMINAMMLWEESPVLSTSQIYL